MHLSTQFSDSSCSDGNSRERGQSTPEHINIKRPDRNTVKAPRLTSKKSKIYFEFRSEARPGFGRRQLLVKSGFHRRDVVDERVDHSSGMWGKSGV